MQNCSIQIKEKTIPQLAVLIIKSGYGKRDARQEESVLCTQFGQGRSKENRMP